MQSNRIPDPFKTILDALPKLDSRLPEPMRGKAANAMLEMTRYAETSLDVMRTGVRTLADRGDATLQGMHDRLEEVRATLQDQVQPTSSPVVDATVEPPPKGTKHRTK